MLYQAAVILTYPVMLGRGLTPSALRGPARRRPRLALQVPGFGRGFGRGGHTQRRGGGAVEATAAAQPDVAFTWWPSKLSGSIRGLEGWEALREASPGKPPPSAQGCGCGRPPRARSVADPTGITWSPTCEGSSPALLREEGQRGLRTRAAE